jgi:hypothetical protein
MSQGLKIIILIFSGVLACALILFFVAPLKRGNVSEDKAKSEILPKTEEVVVKPVLEKEPVSPLALNSEAQEREIIRRLASSFAERFGTFSNQANFENITDLYPVMTSRFRAIQERFVEKTRSQSLPSKGYSGITTQVVLAEVPEIQTFEGRVRVLVKTQREEEKEGKIATRYQDLELKLENQAGEWKVDEAVWK